MAQVLPFRQPELPGDEVIATWFSHQVVLLPNGHRIGVSVAGQGLPVVFIHGFTANGYLYAQMLSRLAGVKVITIDLAGHGKTQPLREGRFNLHSYVDTFRAALDALGIEQAIVVGHSLGAYVATEFAAVDPARVSALVVVNGIVGQPWDELSRRMARDPRLLASFLRRLLVDCAGVVAGRQGNTKLLGPVAAMLSGNLRRFWHLLPPGLSILRADSSATLLDILRQEQLPVYVLHGENDPAVPLATAKDAALRTNGQLMIIEGAGHSWLLQDADTFPSVFRRLMTDHGLNEAFWRPLTDQGFDPDGLRIEQMEELVYPEDGLIWQFPPTMPDERRLRRLNPRYNARTWPP